MLGAHIACRLKYIHLLTHKQTHTHTHTSLVSPSQAGSISMLNPRWTSNPPPEVLLLCLQVALPGVLPAASRFHVAEGIILPFVCVCASTGVYGLRSSVTPSQVLSFISVFCSGTGPASLPHRWLAGPVFPEAPEQGSEAAAGRRLREEQSEEGRNSQTAAL